MNVLFIADPNSIHDIRWVNFFANNGGVRCFLLPRLAHYNHFDHDTSALDPRVMILPPIADPSTVRPIRNWRQVLKIKRAIEQFRVQLLHVIYAEPNALWANGKWFFKIPMILTTRGTDVLVTIPSLFAKRDILSLAVAFQYKRALKKFDAITCTSRSQMEALVKLGINRPMGIIRTGVNFDCVYEQAKVGSGRQRIDKPFVLMPRSMKPIYNHEFTLDAINLLQNSIRKRYAFVFINSVGEGDGYYRRIYAKSKTIDADIRFFPKLSHRDLMGLCQAASLVVMNPTSDGSPVSAMEAMASKRPLILPPLPYDDDIFEGAYFFDQWIPLALKEKIEGVLQEDSRELKAKLEANFQRIQLRANSRIEMQKVAEIYKRLITE